MSTFDMDIERNINIGIDVQMSVLIGMTIIFPSSVKSVCSTGSRKFINVTSMIFKEINRGRV